MLKDKACIKCGAEMHGVQHNRKYCDSCSKDARKEKQRLCMARRKQAQNEKGGTVVSVCISCGKLYNRGKSNSTGLCRSCRAKAGSETLYDSIRSEIHELHLKKGQVASPIAIINNRARKKGLTYGQYVALHGDAL